MIDPRYPIGKYEPQVFSHEQKEKWFAEDFEQALQTIYCVDLMPDNVKLCQDRLLCGQEHLRHIVEKNIVCADALRYHYRFDGTHPYDDEVKAKQNEEHFKSLGLDQCEIVSTPKLKKVKLKPIDNFFE